MSLAIECGATASVALYANHRLEEAYNLDNTKRYYFGPANFKLLKPIELQRFFKNIADTVQEKALVGIAVAMPGILTDSDRKTLKNIVTTIWPDVQTIWVGNDLESAMARLPVKEYSIRVIVISGTGSCCYGTDGNRKLKIGGYGHVMGDRGSAYAIAHRALRLALKEFEHKYSDDEGRVVMPAKEDSNNNEEEDDSDGEKNKSTCLIQSMLTYLNLVSVYELVNWSLVANKNEIAGLARTVVNAAQAGNHIAQTVIEEATDEIVDDIVVLIDKLKAGRPIDASRIAIGLTGSVFLKNRNYYTALAAKKLKEKKCEAEIVFLTDTVFGALKMILDDKRKLEDPLMIKNEETPTTVSKKDRKAGGGKVSNGERYEYLNANSAEARLKLREQILPKSNGLADTEQRNIRSWKLSSMDIAEAVELMIDEERRANQCLLEHVSAFVQVIDMVTKAFKCGGRLFYVGAGTSGRLGILDASECPPTFKTPPHWVQGIIAGGTKAIQNSIEFAEDSIEDGIANVVHKDVCDRDVVIGIAACGKTPFVWGALHEAKNRGAYTCLLTFNTKIESKIDLDQLIAVSTGPEVLTGSTRLKAGTITKVVLNMITTLSMVKYGKCLENLMIDLMPVNQKLRERAVRITMLIVNDSMLSENEAKAVLVKNNYDIKKSVAQLRQE